jgi:hypothetical protein
LASRPILALLLGSALALAAQGSPLAAQTEGPELVYEVQLSPTEKLGTIQGLPAHRARGPVYEQAPPPPPIGVHLRELEEEQPRVPIIEDGLHIPPEQMTETESIETSEQPQAAGTFVTLRNSSITPAFNISSVNEPSVGSQGDGIFTTFNWYAAVSTNNGASVSYVSPYSTFPSSPSAFSAGFCCDQRVAQDSSRNLVFWYLQYIKTGSSSSSTNGVRLAVAHGQAGLAANSWLYYDFTPSLFGLPAGTWLDFPHMQASANYLYFTTNVFNTTTDSYYGALVVRIPLSQLDSGSSLTFNYLSVVGSYGSIMPVNGAAAEGTRPGRTTMYFASILSSTSIKVLSWPESSTSLTISTVSGLASTGTVSFVCPGPDGLDPCTRASVRMQTGWITDTELGLMWNSAQNGSTRPYPYVRVAILNPSTLAVLGQPDIFNTTNAWLYPAMSVNERGHLGGTADYLGGTQYPTIVAIIRDDFSPDPATSGWEGYLIAASNSGTSGRYGDYNGAMPHEKYPKTWLATGHRQVGGSSDFNSVTHNYWFSRERDNPNQPTTCTSFSINPTGANPSAASGSQAVTVTGSPAGCQGGSWSASGNGSWLTVSPTSGSGSGSTTVFWTQNTSTSSRSSSATIAGNSFNVNQQAPPGVQAAVPPADFDGDGVSDWVIYRNGAWLYFGPCNHLLNATGPALDPACSPCVATVCSSDSFCCATSWDGVCVSEAGSLCQ